MTITSLPDVERRLRDVRSVALGGMLLENRPSTLVRTLLRAGAAGLFLCSAPAASWDADALVGAGRVNNARIPQSTLAGPRARPAPRARAAAAPPLRGGPAPTPSPRAVSLRPATMCRSRSCITS